MFFVSGIHGAGKEILCEEWAAKFKMKRYSASRWIQEESNVQLKRDKRTDHIMDNQYALLKAVKRYKETDSILLDGHFCLLNEEGKIQKIPERIFAQMPIKGIIAVKADPGIIKNNLYHRDGLEWSEEFICEFQNKEILQAKRVAGQLRLKIIVIDRYESLKGERFISKYVQDSILLSIKPEFVKKIFAGKKKYEYRRRLCREDIKKIIIYETAPVKKIVGEVEVNGKLVSDRESLWQESEKYAGVEKEFFDQYFGDEKRACAYVLGKVTKYQNPLELRDLGIDFPPQSYLYLNSKDERLAEAAAYGEN